MRWDFEFERTRGGTGKVLGKYWESTEKVLGKYWESTKVDLGSGTARARVRLTRIRANSRSFSISQAFSLNPLCIPSKMPRGSGVRAT